MRKNKTSASAIGLIVGLFAVLPIGSGAIASYAPFQEGPAPPGSQSAGGQAVPFIGKQAPMSVAPRTTGQSSPEASPCRLTTREEGSRRIWEDATPGCLKTHAQEMTDAEPGLCRYQVELGTVSADTTFDDWDLHLGSGEGESVTYTWPVRFKVPFSTPPGIITRINYLQRDANDPPVRLREGKRNITVEGFDLWIAVRRTDRLWAAGLEWAAVEILAGNECGDVTVRSQSTAVDQLIGAWETEPGARSRGGIGTTYRFDADGTVCVSLGAMPEYERYRMEGDRVISLSRDGKVRPEAVMDLYYDAERDRLIGTLQREQSEGQVIWKRVGERGAQEASIVGTWQHAEVISADPRGLDTEHMLQSRDFMMKNSRYIFTSDGRTLFRLPFRTDCGTYTVEGATLTMTIKGQTTKMSFRIDDDSLILGGVEGTESTYERAPF